ncbi:hypothetical protein KDL01_14750 [Actinospica durhamensis]|uniref:Uncharacterized protein n=1 Tax=Actinospica durhamensis TaxID=1508375 RepID=A0A941ELA8_9ACTN|nr:hypothetical protein [Actinospica durhamensis]MBR7834530.1 hypothetical protein [Actinospica durhamensis]
MSRTRLLRDRRFDREFADLTRNTDIDWYRLRGPGPRPAGLPSPVTAVDELRVLPLTVRDRSRFVRDWNTVCREFDRDPRRTPSLAEQLVASLLLTRGLVPTHAPDPTVLPASWVFPSADGYRLAQRAATLAARERCEGTASSFRTATTAAAALRLFEAFFMEILTSGRWLGVDRTP